MGIIDQELKIGKKLSPHDDFSGSEVEDAGWTFIDIEDLFCGKERVSEYYQIWDDVMLWVRTNADLVNDVRYHMFSCFYFRLEQDAMAFKLRWL